MGTEGSNGGIVLYLGDTRVGELTKFDSIPAIEPSEPFMLGEQRSGPAELKFTSSDGKIILNLNSASVTTIVANP